MWGGICHNLASVQHSCQCQLGLTSAQGLGRCLHQLERCQQLFQIAGVALLALLGLHIDGWSSCGDLRDLTCLASGRPTVCAVHNSAEQTGGSVILLILSLLASVGFHESAGSESPNLGRIMTRNCISWNGSKIKFPQRAYDQREV